jgi:predicted nucleotidyltransferase
LNPNYKNYSFAAHKEVYLILEEIFQSFGVHYYLIGANARDVQLYKAGVMPSRGTADIDFAVMIPDMATYDAVMNKFKANNFEEAYGGLPYRLYYSKTNTVIDLLPYGQVEQDGTVSFKERHIELSAVGMKEVGEITEDFEHPEGFTLPVTPLHGMVILKFIAWSERPEMRSKDLADIKALVDIAWENYKAELYAENSPHTDLFDADNFSTDIAGARLLGRKMQTVLNQNNNLNTQIRTVLKNELNAEVGPMAKQMVSDLYETVEELKTILQAIFDGLHDEVK